MPLCTLATTGIKSGVWIRPLIACILNIGRDHLDCYKDEADIVETFCQFASGTRPNGLIVANGEDPNVARAIQRISEAGRGDRLPSVVTFGLDRQCTFWARNVRETAGHYEFDVLRDGQLLGAAKISLPGMHNVYNGMAVVAMAVSLGVDPAKVLDALDGFEGMDRRLMLKGQLHGVTVLDDYAHHPTEIKASLQAIRERYRPARLWCVFQAHQYSRTRCLLEEFAGSFTEADTAILPEIYFVRDSEASRSEVNAEILAERIRSRGTDARHIGGFGEVCDYLEQHVQAGDVVVAMGAGDVWKVADEYIQRLRRDR